MVLNDTREIVIGFLIVATIFYFYSDSIVQFISSQNPLIILLLSTLLNPVYLFLLYTLFKKYSWRGLVAGFLISTTSDIISLPHLIARNAQPATASLNLLSDNIVFNLLPAFLRNNIGVFLLYLGIPLLVIIISLQIVHKKKFKEIFMKSI